MPGQQLGLIGMRGESADGMDACAYRDIFAKQVQAVRPVDDSSGGHASRRITHEDYAAVGAPEMVAQVVAYPAAGTHAGFRHDHAAAVYLVQGHRLWGFAGKAQIGRGEEVLAAGEQRQGIGIVAFWVAPEDFGGGDGHRRVQKYGWRVGQAAVLDPGTQVVLP
ncbi:hypothetical protein BI364_12300 [Acidihalobacter yilgarnensis]|uniref:Uncharacterized protein n=1 Tax=Acidihalobacter yilgarnensis TaxID=2819280 RepID=A0A1D8IQC3_9GAMM|nr:hypothetical protein [Acidihalobacter yilgarnensis]AOU98635.1 hypothetical protein BI364_12300 [Acidihalobacter yilgarnensis]